MGVNLRELVKREEISVSDLKGKVIAFDAYNMLFQFLSNIRSPEGMLLTNKNGEITSHLIGLFSRTTRFMIEGIRPVFVFDGVHPELKKVEVQRRREAKKEAQKKYDAALEEGHVGDMKKFAARTSHLSPEMVAHAKELLRLLGLPVIQAPSEGEAQAAYLTQTNQAYAVGSQDYDSLLYGGTRLIQNLSIAGRRKKVGRVGTVVVKPEMISLDKTLSDLGLSRRQLIALAMMVGTDFSPGINGIGPKKGMKLVKEHGDNLDALFAAVKWSEHCEADWKDVYELFMNMPVEKEVHLKWGAVQADELINFLVDKHDFSRERVEKTLDELGSKARERTQQTLGGFFS